MKLVLRRLGIGLAALFALNTGLHAQSPTLAPGTWTGSIVDPGGEEASVTYEVSVTGDTLRIELKVPEGPSFSFSNIRFEGGSLLFTWLANISIECKLDAAEAGSYSGTCTDSSGESGHMTMVPPRNG